MPSDKMLIDATHPEETRVVVLRNNRVEEFDYESAAKKLLRGNIYLAKVTRVEPSLQAAFVDYGGNRHGFLAFNEIHPDYYQIPVADRKALLEAEAEAAALAEAEADAAEEAALRRREAAGVIKVVDENVEFIEEDDHEPENIDETGGNAAPWAEEESSESGESFAEMAQEPPEAATAVTSAEPESAADPAVTMAEAVSHDTDVRYSEIIQADLPALQTPQFAPGGDDQPDSSSRDERVAEDRGSEDFQPAEAPNEAGHADGQGDEIREDVAPRRPRRMRSYKIQEVVRRRQIMLVQVVKEERGNKGAALTTYLSLAGRYTVLMPNTGRGGGISRKITNAADRKRLKEIATELEIPEGMGLIVRTAGASRTKAEVKRDFEYLLRLWENVRDLTLQSTAPALVYEEGNLIKRSIRDLYSKEIGKVIVAGDGAYRDAKEFMRMIMPSHAANVVPYQSPEPLFVHYQIERQLNAMYSPTVTLRSGGYIVINQTEALVAIDVNSGRSTREHNIEDTAFATNIEACDEIARQLRLRDLAGLIVIDFIDMEERRNDRHVERRLKEALKSDRARIQVGRISHFGLMEMSRQRLRTGIVEGSTSQCPHCQGSGVIRSVESVSLAILRSIEDTLAAGRRRNLTAVCSVECALYLLNNKRHYLLDIEDRHGIKLTISADNSMHGATFRIDIGEERHDPKPLRQHASINAIAEAEIETVDGAMDDSLMAESHDEQPTDSANGELKGHAHDGGEEGDRRGRRRRRRRGRDRERGEGESLGGDGTIAAMERAADDAVEDGDGGEGEGDGEAEVEDIATSADGERGRRRRRGRRGGRRHRGHGTRDLVASEALVGANGIDAQSSVEYGATAKPSDAEHRSGEAMPLTSDAFIDSAVVTTTSGAESWMPEQATRGGAHPAVTWESAPTSAWNTDAQQPPQAWHSELVATPDPLPLADRVESVPLTDAEPIHGEGGNGDARHDAQRSEAQSDLREHPVNYVAEPPATPVPPPPPELPTLSGPPRKGWWQRRFSGD